MKITTLKKIRKNNGITQETLAERASVPVRTLQRYESGERIPDAVIAIRIAKALNTSVEKLFENNDNTD